MGSLCRRAVLVACGAAGAGFGTMACTFGSVGASGGSLDIGDATGGSSGSGAGPSSSVSSGGELDDAGIDASGDPSGSLETTGGPPIPGTTTTTTGDLPSDSSGDETTATTTGGNAFALCDAADPDLRACYDFVDAGSGTLHDLSGEGNDGTVSQVIVAAGPFGETVRVSDNASILVPDSASLDIPPPHLSFDAWVYLDSEPPPGVRRGVFDKDGQYSLMLFGGEGLRCGFGDTNIFAAPPFAQWFHVACVGSENGTRMYIDGLEVQGGGPFFGGIIENVEPMAICDNSPQLDQPLDGEIAALRIFSRTLGSREVAEAAAAPI